MTKAELVKSVAQKASLKQKEAESALDAFVQAVVEAVKNGSEVKIPGFGSFTVVERAARQGKNPQTGEPIAIPARKTVVFRAGKSLKSVVN
ncbi:MAG: HU family DNA-binding protein [Firmicutes bacterium]|nr:HU family DNA-binding protein [Bacillota bacterium]